MDITPFIRELLFGHDCVIVPGLGGFVGNYTPARIDRATSTFFPPLKEISFNRNLKHNDGLLAGRISSYAGIGYGDSRSIIESFVASVVKKLERGERVVFDLIGTFSMNNEGSIQFEPAPGINYNLDSYGLEPFTFAPLEGYDGSRRIAERTGVPEAKPMQLRRILWRAAVIIPLLGILAVLPFRSELFKAGVETSTMNPLVSAELEANRKAIDEAGNPAPVNDAQIAADNEADMPAQAVQTEPVIQIAVAEPENSYCLITGSFRSRQNAEVQASQLKEAGFDAEILEASNGFFRVSAMRCTTIGDAVDAKKNISVKFPGTWVKKQ